VLLVSPGLPRARALIDGLRAEGLAVTVVRSLAKGDEAARAGVHDAITLDLSGWEGKALDLLGRWRREGVKSPVLLLTADRDGRSGVRGLNAGADTFLAPPVTPALLLAQLRALLRPAALRAAAVLHAHDLRIDTAARAVWRDGQPLRLTRREYELLLLLATHRGQVVSRALIWERLYDGRIENISNVVEVYIRLLRGKVDRGFDTPLILTCWGRGYMLRGD
jgi:DNA-binding response OmpR family regulator